MRYVKNIFYAALGWLIMPLVAGASSFLVVSVIFPALCKWFPDIFINYSPVTQHDAYAVMTAILSIISATCAIAFYSYILVRFDNERMEFMIKRTDGMYTSGEGAALYYPRYIFQDLAVAIIIPVPLPIASVFVPTHIADYIDPVFNYLFSFGRMYTDYLGVPFGILTACAVVFITRILAAPKSLRAWQGIWLSETN